MPTHGQSPEELMRDIRQTRRDLDQTVEALEGRLSPDRMMQQVGGVISPAREESMRFVQNLGAAVRDNPIPAALLGIGVGWLMFAGRRPDDDGVWREDLYGDERSRLDPNRPVADPAFERATVDPEVTAEAAESRARAARDEAVGMVLRGRLAVGALDLLLTRPARQPQQGVGIALRRADMGDLDAFVLKPREPENVRDAREIILLVRRHTPVGLGDVEQPVEHVLQHGGVVAEFLRQAPGVAVKAQRGLLGEIEGALQLRLEIGRGAEDLGEGFDFRARHLAIGLGHFGAEPDQRHRELGIVDPVPGRAVPVRAVERIARAGNEVR